MPGMAITMTGLSDHDGRNAHQSFSINFLSVLSESAVSPVTENSRPEGSIFVRRVLEELLATDFDAIGTLGARGRKFVRLAKSQRARALRIFGGLPLLKADGSLSDEEPPRIFGAVAYTVGVITAGLRSTELPIRRVLSTTLSDP